MSLKATFVLLACIIVIAQVQGYILRSRSRGLISRRPTNIISSVSDADIVNIGIGGGTRRISRVAVPRRLSVRQRIVPRIRPVSTRSRGGVVVIGGDNDYLSSGFGLGIFGDVDHVAISRSNLGLAGGVGIFDDVDQVSII